MSPHQRYRNREIEDGQCLFCKWVETCSPREDALRGPLFGERYDDHYDCGFDDFNDAETQRGDT